MRHHAHSVHASGAAPRTTLHVGGPHYASGQAVAEQVLGKRTGVLDVEANPVAQTATVTFDSTETTVAELPRWIEACGFHCAGQSVPGHLCDPLAEPGDGARPAEPGAHRHATASLEAAAYDYAAIRGADEAHGHGHGGHAGMSMGAMVRDMRNRFLDAVSGSSVLVAVTAVALKRLELSRRAPTSAPAA